MNVTDAPSGILNPQQPWYSGNVGEKIWVILKARLTGGKAFGQEYSSFVNLTSADADRLIENLKKDPRGYPQVNQTGGAGGYENLQKYQEWLREEYLEKPFQQQTNQKIEDAAIESRLKEIQEERKQKATSFISGATSFRPGKKMSLNVTNMQGIIPKRSIPSELVQKISSPIDNSTIQVKQDMMGRAQTPIVQSQTPIVQSQTPSIPPPSPEMTKNFQMSWDNRNNESAREEIESSWNNMTVEQQQQAKIWAESKAYNWSEMKLNDRPSTPSLNISPTQTQKIPTPTIQSKQEDSSSLGRLLFNFIQINNDLEAIKEVIEEDFKTTKEKNKQEVDEYKKRVANRGRKLTTKELGSDKKSVTESIKPFISNFFSGAGGAIRSLALLKMLLGILNGDISSVFKGLFGIGLSFLPKIGMMIAGGILKNLLASMAGRAVGGGISRGVGGGISRGVGGGISRGVGGGMGKAPIATPTAGFGKWAKIASLGTGALALGSAFSTSNQDQQQESVQQPETQKRLEELTLQQKSSPEVSSIAQEDLKKFQELNMRFEKALEFFIETYKKTMQDRGQQRPSSSGGGGGGGPMANPYDIPGLTVDPGSISTLDQFKSVLKGTPMEAEAEAVYNMALKEGLNPAFVAGLAGAESSFGSKGKAVGRNNPFNYGVYRNQTYGSYAESTQGLARALRDPEGYYYGEGRTDLKSILQKYSPSSDGNNIPVHMRNIMGIGARTGGDANTIFIPLNSGPSITPNQPAIQPSQRPDGRRSSALSGSGSQPNLSVTVVPVSSNKQGAVAANSGTNLPSIDPNYSGDRFSLLTAGELNLVGALG